MEQNTQAATGVYVCVFVWLTTHLRCGTSVMGRRSFSWEEAAEYRGFMKSSR